MELTQTLVVLEILGKVEGPLTSILPSRLLL